MIRNFPIWAETNQQYGLQDGEVHVWLVDLDEAASALAQLEGTLTEDELERTRRFRFEHHRRQYITSRGMLRRLLGHYLAEAPDQIRFSYGPQGKPYLAGSSTPKLFFNLAHSHKLALYAFSTGMDLGIDMEYMQPIEDAAQIVWHYFSLREARAYFSLPQPEQKQLAFFQAWTRKEAFLKATGEGLATPLDQVEVTLGFQDYPQFLSLPAPFLIESGWYLVDLRPHPCYYGALAINGAVQQISCWRWVERA
jgi:4'-phosphopantetheinyl transferase